MLIPAPAVALDSTWLSSTVPLAPVTLMPVPQLPTPTPVQHENGVVGAVQLAFAVVDLSTLVTARFSGPAITIPVA